MKFGVVQLQGERVIKTREKNRDQQQSERETDRGAGETLREADPSYSCPAGERIGGDWGGPAGTCNWLHADCVCVCVQTDCHFDRECLVCRGPCRLP